MSRSRRSSLTGPPAAARLFLALLVVASHRSSPAVTSRCCRTNGKYTARSTQAELQPSRERSADRRSLGRGWSVPHVPEQSSGLPAKVEQLRLARLLRPRAGPRPPARDCAAHSAAISSASSSMKAVVNASATAPGASLGPSSTPATVSGRGSATHAASRPRTGSPVRGSTMWSPLRTPEADNAVWRIERRASTRDGAPGSLNVSGQPSRPAGGSSARTELKPPWTSARSKSPLLEQFRHQVDRVALADAAQVDLHPVGRRANQEAIGVQFERRQPRADRDVEGAACQVEHVARDHEALERRRADPRALARRQVVDPRDVAVGPEAAQLVLEAVRRESKAACAACAAYRSSGCTAYTSNTVFIASCEKRRTSPSSRGPAIPSPPSKSGSPARMKDERELRSGRRLAAPDSGVGWECWS